MREIKFRAWDKECDVMLKDSDIKSDYVFYFDREEYEIMQYTGLKDKNDVEIYESDLIKDEFGFIKEVIWRKSGWYLKDGDVIYNLFEYAKHDIVVVGNKYEKI